MFRYKSGIPLSYNRQGYIYFASLQYRSLSHGDQRKIDELCLEVAGRDSYALALKEYVTTNTRGEIIEAKYNVSKSTLHRLVRDYYCRFPKKL